MKYTDIAIIGGGLAGSTATAMLGRAGIPTVLIDPHQVYPFDFRVEKISGDEQLDRFYRTGIADSVLRSATHDGENWIARFGYLLDKKPSRQYGIMYDALIGAVRAEIQPPAELVYAKVTDVATSAERQTVTLSDGETISARLVVLANGLSVGLRRNLGIERQVISASHSISIGFDLVPVGRPAFEFPALTYFSERTKERVAYVTLFPIGNRMRANLFVYREVDDPWLREMRHRPVETMNAVLPRLRRITGEYAVAGNVKIRPADVYVSTGYRQPGIVLVGDAFAATCPVTGTGTDKVFTDVAQLCNVHIPAWLASEGMSEAKIASFYDDPVKQACDAWSMGKAISFRKLTIENGPYWRAQRWARFLAWFGEGALRRMRSRASADSSRPAHSSSSSSSSSLSSSA
ncbi:2-polyprenyl-6-methoxyphenol hydroxylase [Bradyrhizobium jicamae]|uniref:2-polyprenyl-6-methoxyphenol hydroxylase n=1 Tax=Bradyrhizobium jicamae TaxID=280332 RepID=A0A0R3LZS6_9BRAD|nr:NAD(P)/FAD-dependent oxidoreductase [Bradyrhizobium jicamae]KRR13377.1 2-polyprenyl-6-methoxyphenol hydroxylase [Bradyrhizobium jicamae]